MMAFSLEPDCYDSWVDHNIKEAVLKLIADEEEEDEVADVS